MVKAAAVVRIEDRTASPRKKPCHNVVTTNTELSCSATKIYANHDSERITFDIVSIYGAENKNTL